MKVSLIIPTLEESKSLAKTISFVPKNSVDEIIIVDGHSKDNTVEIAKTLGCRTFLQPGKGYGNALAFGAKKAKGDIIIFMDADGSHNPKVIPLLVKKIKENYDMVLASRYLKGAGSDDDTPIRYLGNMFFTFLVNKIHKLNISDSLYLFTAIKKEAFKKINPTSNDMEFCVEILIKAKKKGIKIAQVPAREPKRLGGQSKVNVFYHGLRILFWILKKY